MRRSPVRWNEKQRCEMPIDEMNASGQRRGHSFVLRVQQYFQSFIFVLVPPCFPLIIRFTLRICVLCNINLGPGRCARAGARERENGSEAFPNYAQTLSHAFDANTHNPYHRDFYFIYRNIYFLAFFRVLVSAADVVLILSCFFVAARRSVRSFVLSYARIDTHTHGRCDFSVILYGLPRR